MRRYQFALVLLLASTTIHAAAPASMEIDRSASAIAGREATFTQTFTPKGFKSGQIESGTVLFGSMPMMRWTYAKPEPKVFVFDGKQSWFYLPDEKQVTVATIDQKKKEQLPFLLIGDPSARALHFATTEQIQGKSVVTTLKSKDSNAMVRAVTITSGASDHLIQRIDYSDREGNRTSFDFSGYHAAQASAEAFRFTAPAGVQISNAD